MTHGLSLSGRWHRVVTHRLVTNRVVTHRVVTLSLATYRVVTHMVLTHSVFTHRVVTKWVVTHRVLTHRVVTHKVVTHWFVTYKIATHMVLTHTVVTYRVVTHRVVAQIGITLRVVTHRIMTPMVVTHRQKGRQTNRQKHCSFNHIYYLPFFWISHYLIIGVEALFACGWWTLLETRYQTCSIPVVLKLGVVIPCEVVSGFPGGHRVIGRKYRISMHIPAWCYQLCSQRFVEQR